MDYDIASTGKRKGMGRPVSSSHVRAEHRTIRPFQNIDAADVALREVRLCVDDEVEQPGPVVLPAGTLASADLTLVLPDIALVREQVALTGLHVPDCGFVVLATGRSHRGASAVLFCEHLHKADYSTFFRLQRGSHDLVLSDRQGFTITVAIVLLVDYPGSAPLRPSLAGTWLARRDFNVTTERDQTSFSPEPLTEQVRQLNDLPEGIMRFIDYRSVVGAEDVSDVVTVYVDPSVLNRLYAIETKASAIKEQTELAVQTYSIVATSMVDEIRSELGGEPTETDLSRFPIAEQLLDSIASLLSEALNAEVTVAKVLKFMRTPGFLASHLEVAFNMREITLAVL